jgi:MFS family permease
VDRGPKTALFSRLAERAAPALVDPGFRRYWIGQLISALGAWMQSFTLSWVGMQLSPSPFWQGVLGFSQYIPMTLLTLFAGAVADRVRKRRMLLATQFSLTILATLMGIVFLTGIQSYSLLLVAAVINGTLMAFDLPARHSFVGELVPRPIIKNAIAFNSTAFNIARIIGPMLAGFVMAGFGSGWCFLINALTFIPFLYFIWTSKGGRTVANPNPSGMWRETVQGLKHIARNRVLLRTSIVAFVVMTMVTNYNILIPLTARDSLGLTESGGGILMTWLGIGAIVGSIATAISHRAAGRRGFFEAMCVAAALATLFIGYQGNYAITAVTLVLTGFTFASFTTLTNSVLQTHSSDEYRGRVVAMYSLIVGGTAPIGNLICGSLADAQKSVKDAPWFSWFWCAVICLILLAVIYTIFFFYYRKKRMEAAGHAVQLQAAVNTEAAKELINEEKQDEPQQGAEAGEENKGTGDGKENKS